VRLATFIFNILIIGGIITLTCACSQTQRMSRPSSATHLSGLTGDQFSQEIHSLEKITRSDADLSRKKSAHLTLADLYISFKNPERNYKMALAHLENYAALDPAVNEQYEVQDWLAALKEMDRFSMAISGQKKQIKKMSLQIKNASQKNSVHARKKTKLARQNDKLKQINEKLRKKNQELEQTIEKLKNLDRRLEEKRKSFN